MTQPPAVADITTLVEVFVARLIQRGAIHPVPAALAMAARGGDGGTIAEFAARHDLDVAEVEAAERGDLPLESLPAYVSDILDRTSRIDLLAMADLDADVRRARAARQTSG